MSSESRLPYREHLEGDAVLTDLVDRAVNAIEDLELFIGEKENTVSRKAGMAALAGANQAIAHLSHEVHAIKSDTED